MFPARVTNQETERCNGCLRREVFSVTLVSGRTVAPPKQLDRPKMTVETDVSGVCSLSFQIRLQPRAGTPSGENPCATQSEEMVCLLCVLLATSLGEPPTQLVGFPVAKAGSDSNVGLGLAFYSIRYIHRQQQYDTRS